MDSLISSEVFQVDVRQSILNSSLEQILRTLHAERVLIAMVKLSDGPLHLLGQRGFVGDVQLESIDISLSTIQSVFQAGKCKNLIENTTEEQHEATASMKSAGLRSVLCAPISHPSYGALGVLYVDDKRRIGAFGQEHLDWLERFGRALASHALCNPIQTQPEPEEQDTYQLWNRYRCQALTAQKQGELSVAESCFKRALACCDGGELGPLRYARTLNDLSEILRLQGLYDKAEVLIREAIQAVESMTDPVEHRLTIPIYNNFAGLLFARGLVSEARGIYQAILARLEGSGGGQAASVIPVLCNLGTICLKSGQAIKALQYFHEANTLAELHWGESHPASLQCRQKISDCERLIA